MQRHEREEFQRATLGMSATPGFQLMQGLAALALLLLGWLVVPLEMMARRQFGERYLGLVRLIMAGVVFLWFTIIAAATEENISVLMILLLLVSVGLAIYHKIVISRRSKHRIPWHSRSFGVSHLQGRVPGDDWWHYRAIEPGIFAVLGLLLAFTFHQALGIYLLAGAVGLALRAQAVYADYRDQYLDRMDSLIEAEFWSGDHKEAGKEANAGFSPVRMSADLAAMIAKTETTLTRRGVPIPASPVAVVIQPFEDIDAAVSASMGRADAEPEFTPAATSTQPPQRTTTPPSKPEEE